jgi:hypothetical protein
MGEFDWVAREGDFQLMCVGAIDFAGATRLSEYQLEALSFAFDNIGRN